MGEVGFNGMILVVLLIFWNVVNAQNILCSMDKESFIMNHIRDCSMTRNIHPNKA
jgi:hypothetical protein